MTSHSYSHCRIFGKGTPFDVRDLCGFETKWENGKCVATDSTCRDVEVGDIPNNFTKLQTCSKHGCQLTGYTPSPDTNIHDLDLTASYCSDVTHCSSNVTGATLTRAACDAHSECAWTNNECDKAKQHASLTLRSDCGFLGLAGIFNFNRIDPSTYCGKGAYFNTSRNVCESAPSQCPPNYYYGPDGCTAVDWM